MISKLNKRNKKPNIRKYKLNCVLFWPNKVIVTLQYKTIKQICFIVRELKKIPI